MERCDCQTGGPCLKQLGQLPENQRCPESWESWASTNELLNVFHGTDEGMDGEGVYLALKELKRRGFKHVRTPEGYGMVIPPVHTEEKE